MKLAFPSPLTAAQVVRAARDLRRFTKPSAADAGKRRVPYVSNLNQLSQLWWNDVVMGYGIAEEQTDCRPTGRLSIRFYVNRKLPKARLKAAQRIPSSLRVRTTGNRYAEVPTDVVELRRLPAAQRTVRAGDSMGHFIGLQGTFGLAVRDAAGDTYALTCAHVVAPHFLDPTDAPVESPMDTDGVAGPNVMGTVFSWTQLDDTILNTADAALVRPANGITLSNAALNLSSPPRFSTITPAQFANVRNRPAIVQTRRGAVHAVLDSIANDLPFDFNGRPFRFTDVASYIAGVEPGDSGSAVIDGTSGEVLGLHFAGNRVERVGFCILSSTILRAFVGMRLNVTS
jgi:hypothetical protein